MAVRRAAFNVIVYPHDWVCVVSDLETRQGNAYHNNNQSIKDVFMTTDSYGRISPRTDIVFGGFGSNRYDQYIIKAIIQGFTPEQLYNYSNFIKSGQLPWNYPGMNNARWNITSTDLAQDAPMSLSIPLIAGHLGHNIPTYRVPEDPTRPLSSEEFISVRDTAIAENRVIRGLLNIRAPYLNAKELIGQRASIGLTALRYTNAKLCSVFFGARKTPFNDSRDYRFPNNLNLEYIPAEMVAFYEALHDPNLTDEQVFSNRKLVLVIGGCEITIGGGGVHGAIPNYDSNNIPKGRLSLYLDVESFYPSLVVNNGYISRSIPPENRGLYEGVVNDRKAEKRRGNKSVADALKLIVNTFYGAMLASNNDLFDALMGRSTVYSGQLYLIELLNHLATEFKDLKVIMANTDGFNIECNESDVPGILAIVDEWQNRTGLRLERDNDISRIVQKNVNNYIEVKTDGSLKLVGDLKRGVEQTSGFRCNNTANIITEAATKYILDGTPVEKTIGECQEIRKFQYITNTANAAGCFTYVNGMEQPLDLVNRVYASKDMRADSIYIKDANGNCKKATASSMSLPEHCIVDNDNKLTVKDIDLNFYIAEACKLAESYVNHPVPVNYVSYDNQFSLDSVELDISDLEFDDMTSATAPKTAPITQTEPSSEVEEDLVSKLGLNKYGIDSLMQELEAEDTPPKAETPFLDSLKSDYCIFTENRGGVNYLCQCHIYDSITSEPYLNVMSIPLADAFNIYKECGGNMEMTENAIFVNAEHRDFSVSDKFFDRQLDYLKSVVESSPETLVCSSEITQALRDNIDVSRGEINAVL